MAGLLSNFIKWGGLIVLFMIREQTQAQQWNLLSALEESKTNYPLIKASLAEVNNASREVKVSHLEYLPKVSAQHQYTYATSNSLAGSFYPNPTIISPSGGIRSENSFQPTWGSFTSAMIEWNVFSFGKVLSQQRFAKSNLENKQAVYDNEVFQHQVKVADAYLLTLIAKKLSAIQSLNVERARHLREAVDAGVRSGMRPGVDSSLAHAEYTKATMLLLGSDQNEKTQYYRLRELCGSIEMEVQQLDSMIFFTKLPKQTDYNSMPATTNPLLLAYQTKAKATEARSKMIKLSFLPSISVVGSAWARGSGVSSVDDSFKTDFSSGTNYQVYNYLVGISTRWVISDFFSIHQKYKGEQHLLERDNELYEHQNLKTKWQVNESNLQYDVALEQARIAPIQLAAARQAYAQANARYKSGLSDMPTFLQSLVTLNRAEADLAIAYSNVWRSLLAIAAAKGDLTDFIDAIKE